MSDSKNIALQIIEDFQQIIKNDPKIDPELSQQIIDSLAALEICLWANRMGEFKQACQGLAKQAQSLLENAHT